MSQKVHHQNCPICHHHQLDNKLKVKDYTVSQEVYDLVECAQCHFLMTQDAPDMASIGRYYQGEDYVSHSDTKKGFFFKAYHVARSIMLNKKYRAIAHNMAADSGKKILDIGSGRGYFLNHMKHKGFDCYGIEQDETARTLSRQDFNLKVENSEALFQFQENTFDVITLWHVLEHIHDFRGYLEQIKKILKPKGLLVIALPNPDAYDCQMYGTLWAGWDVPIHLWHFKPSNIESLLEQFSYQLIQKKAMPFDPFYLSVIASKERGDKFPMISGFWNGFKAYLKSYSKINKATSITYYFKENY